MIGAVERAYTDAEIDAALAALSEADRLRDAQELIAHAAPRLQHVLDEALSAGGWFGDTHDKAVAAAADTDDADERRRVIDGLLREETQLGMLVGVAVGFELARTLETNTSTEGD